MLALPVGRACMAGVASFGLIAASCHSDVSGSCANECPAEAVTSCVNGLSRTCSVDSEGCLSWSIATPCADGFCEDAETCGVCNNVCPAGNATECSVGELRTCVADGNGCLAWGAPAVCPQGFCADGTTCGACSNSCSVESATSCSGGELSTCTADLNGCLSWSASTPCSDGFCEDAETCGICNNLCPAESATACLAGELRICIADGNGCLDWGAASACPQGFCADESSCGVCTHECDVVGSSCIVDGVTREVCSADTNGCRTASSQVCSSGCLSGRCREPVAAGSAHTCGLLDTGAVKCWGDDRYGQLGDGGMNTDQGAPVAVEGLSGGVVAIAAGTAHTCALLDTGAVKCWGSDGNGQLGEGGTNTDQPTPVDVQGLSSGVVAIAAGTAHTCALLDTGAVKCWGDDRYGQLGDSGADTDQPTPVDVQGLSSGVVAVAAGGDHTCAVLNTGALKCWGSNYWGELGDGSVTSWRTTPVAVQGLSNGVAAIATGGDHTCAVLDTGALKCWGSSLRGQVGDGSTNAERNVPIAVVGLSTGVAAVAAGGEHTCAVLATRAVKCWGSNLRGQVGYGGTSLERDVPVATQGLSAGVVAVAAGWAHTCTLLDTGVFKCWGRSDDGQIGDGRTNADRDAPVDVQGLPTSVVTVAAGRNHTCAVLGDGALECWGHDGSGQLGDGGTSSLQVAPVAVQGLSSGVAAVAAGWSHTCARLDTGALKCWGYDLYGQLGDGGTNTNQPVPVDVQGLSSGVASIAVGYHYVCALLGTGSLKCWGSDNCGQLGDGGTYTDQSTPVSVQGLSSGVVAVAAGGYHTCALLDTGALKCWGSDAFGQLGDGGTNANQSTPVSVQGLSSGVVAVAAGGYHTCALLETGALKCWGYDGNGQLGDGGTNTNQGAPVAVQGLSSGVVAVAAGDSHTCAVVDTGAVVCWGYDYYGQLGDGGTNTDQSTPVDVQGLSSGVVAIHTGANHTCAVLETGVVECWGSDQYGQLADDTCAGWGCFAPVDVLGIP
jgi:alpha-tubulin suppressor-like RCC1 family protein